MTRETTDDHPDADATRRSTGSPNRRARSALNRGTGLETIKVFLGDHAVSDRMDVMMSTTLGSCVSACIHDPVRGIGGMNHFLLPEVPESELSGNGEAARYGSVAMERLINALLCAGAERRRLQVKLFGGARVIDSSYDIGGMNSRFALDYVRAEGLILTGQDLGGASARRIRYFPHAGRAMRRMLNPTMVVDTITQEHHFMSNLRRGPIDGPVELFIATDTDEG
ncbi:chemotaxis protein [Azospirillum griseum]|uniref:Probable chemoreceptor glutamine deamidase CheD n=1 Tax=Azospirillum griseum TaxID=2496639 RepID=A0A431VEC9_9PROT|nr:chemotaxis protein [Azospirillum griseum]RTR17401.1 chemotaxis protein [Azospirillum griseum]